MDPVFQATLTASSIVAKKNSSKKSPHQKKDKTRMWQWETRGKD
jgi:hypothetical protein